MQKKILLILFILSVMTAWSQRRDEGEIGWTQSDLEDSHVSVHFITENEKPAYIMIQGQPGTDPFYFPVKKYDVLKKYFDKVIKATEKLNKEAEETMSGNTSAKLEIPGPEVFLIWPGKMFYNEDKEFKETDHLSATWEFYRSEVVPSGSFIIITAEAVDPSDPLETCNFRMWVTIDELKFIKDKILVKSELEKYINHFEFQEFNKEKFHDEKMKNLQRSL